MLKSASEVIVVFLGIAIRLSTKSEETSRWRSCTSTSPRGFWPWSCCCGWVPASGGNLMSEIQLFVMVMIVMLADLMALLRSSQPPDPLVAW